MLCVVSSLRHDNLASCSCKIPDEVYRCLEHSQVLNCRRQSWTMPVRNVDSSTRATRTSKIIISKFEYCKSKLIKYVDVQSGWLLFFYYYLFWSNWFCSWENTTFILLTDIMCRVYVIVWLRELMIF